MVDLQFHMFLIESMHAGKLHTDNFALQLLSWQLYYVCCQCALPPMLPKSELQLKPAVQDLQMTESTSTRSRGNQCTADSFVMPTWEVQGWLIICTDMSCLGTKACQVDLAA